MNTRLLFTARVFTGSARPEGLRAVRLLVRVRYRAGNQTGSRPPTGLNVRFSSKNHQTAFGRSGW